MNDYISLDIDEQPSTPIPKPVEKKLDWIKIYESKKPTRIIKEYTIGNPAKDIGTKEEGNNAE
jgi:hypothetical protein